MATQTIEALLRQVFVQLDKYENIAQITGENFNIFKILNVETKEVTLHSALIAELLNPTGRHGQKGIFLKLFIKLLDLPDAFETQNADISIEEHVGTIDENYTEGGRVDIIITDVNNNSQIIIENKIYAADQKNQLFRYYNYNPDAILVYLTPWGNPPSDHSCGDMPKEKKKSIKVFSYKEHIIKWLNQCKKEAVDSPIVRETITQYINSIKTITNQTTNNIMKKEIINTIASNPDNVKSFFEIKKNDIENGLKTQLIGQLKEQLIELEKELADTYNIELKFEDSEFGLAESWAVFYKKDSKIGLFLTFGFSGEFINFNHLVHCKEEFAEEYKPKILERLWKRGKGFNQIWADAYEDKYRFINDMSDSWIAISDGSLKLKIRSTIQKIFDKLQDLEG